jgi:predicted metal-binding protein
MFTFANMKYTVTSKETIISADEFISRYRDVERIRQFCLQCPGYGKAWNCPPFDFDPRTVSDGFRTVRFIATIIEFDEQTRAACTSPEQAVEVGRQAMDEVWQSLLPRLYEMERETTGSRVFTFRCVLCPEGCTRPQGKPCRRPEQMRHSLESVGFDIEAMARDLLGITLEWSADGSLAKHITLVTALFSR